MAMGVLLQQNTYNENSNQQHKATMQKKQRKGEWFMHVPHNAMNITNNATNQQ
jgi:hypothetical protein